MELAKNVLKNENYCHDCQKEIKVEDGELKNGVLLNYDDNGKKITVFKCNECYEKNPQLTNFRKCEVYSRIVGYLRPVQQWNKGKKEEYSKRKEFKAI